MPGTGKLRMFVIRYHQARNVPSLFAYRGENHAAIPGNSLTPTPYPTPATTDVCQIYAIACVVQGATPVPPGDPSNCGEITEFWQDSPAPDSDYVTASCCGGGPGGYTDATITPNPVKDGQNQYIDFCAGPQVPEGWQYFSVSGVSTDGDKGTSEATIWVMCSDALADCPLAEIYNTNTGKVVSPTSPGSIVAGQQVNLAWRWKAGTGWDQPYTVDTSGNIYGELGFWSVDGEGTPAPLGYGDAVLNYQLTASPGPSVAPFNSVYNVPTISCYWLGGQKSPAAHLIAGALKGKTVDIADPWTDAPYSVLTPTFKSMSASTTKVQVGIYDGTLALSYGTIASPPGSAGIYSTYVAQAPSSIGGNMAAVQLVQSNTTVLPNPNSSTTPAPYTSTGTAYWADTCILFTTDTSGNRDQNRNLKVTPGEVDIYKTIDAPADFLGPQMNSIQEKDYFEDYFMYRPPGSSSIWVTIGKLTWFWNGLATRTGNPNTWALTSSSSSPATVTGAISHELPIWPQILNPSPPCATVPTS